MIVLGLTGSIGMGKSTVGAMLNELGVPVHESDIAVHDLMQPGQEGYLAVAAAFPYYQYEDIYERKNSDGYRPINRKALGALVFGNEELRIRLEEALHPLVHLAQEKFVKAQRRLGKRIVALDIPLLFEVGAENRVDITIVVSAPYHVQRARVLAREGMSEEKFEAILAAQMPDAEKCARADYVVHTGLGRAQSMKELKAILQELTRKDADE